MAAWKKQKANSLLIHKTPGLFTQRRCLLATGCHWWLITSLLHRVANSDWNYSGTFFFQLDIMSFLQILLKSPRLLSIVTGRLRPSPVDSQPIGEGWHSFLLYVSNHPISLVYIHSGPFQVSQCQGLYADLIRPHDKPTYNSGCVFVPIIIFPHSIYSYCQLVICCLSVAICAC